MNCIYSGGEESPPLFVLLVKFPCYCTIRTTARVVRRLSQLILAFQFSKYERTIIIMKNLEVLITQKGFEREVVRHQDNTAPYIVCLAQEMRL